MPHDRARLETALRELQAELETLSGLDPQVRARLEHTIEEIHAELEEADEAEETEEAEQITSRSASESSFAERLSETARHFEESHPNLAGMVGSVIDALARMGI
jgi:uncharacterized coiled-coil DUF342 family protein